MQIKYKSIALILLVTILNAIGQLFIKKGTINLVWSTEVLTNYNLLIGISIYAISAMLMVIALKFSDLTVLYPFISLTFIWVSLISVYLLNETVKASQIRGIALVLIGVFLIGRSK